MKMNPRAWFNRSHIPMNATESVTFSANDPAGESTLQSELFSTAQMERYGQKLARTHKLSPDKHPYYLLKDSARMRPSLPKVVMSLTRVKRPVSCLPGSGYWTIII